MNQQEFKEFYKYIRNLEMNEDHIRLDKDFDKLQKSNYTVFNVSLGVELLYEYDIDDLIEIEEKNELEAEIKKRTIEGIKIIESKFDESEYFKQKR